VDNDQNIILGMLGDMQGKQNANHLEAMTAIASLQTTMTSLVGNGQPGRIDKIESEMKTQNTFRLKLLGFCSGVSAVVSIIAWLVFKH
jgi:hypothetical protein